MAWVEPIFLPQVTQAGPKWVPCSKAFPPDVPESLLKGLVPLTGLKVSAYEFYLIMLGQFDFSVAPKKATVPDLHPEFLDKLRLEFFAVDILA